MRTTAWFGALALALLSVMGAASYRWARATELAALQARLRALAIAIAEGVDPELPARAMEEGRAGSPAHALLVDRFAAVGADERDVSSIYVVVPTERQRYVRFAADWVREGEPAEVGQLYDTIEMQDMAAGFGGPTVEQEIEVDEWGPSLSGYAPIRDRHGRAVAVIGVDVSASRVQVIEDRVTWSIAIAYGAAALVILGAGLLLGRSIRRPIAAIANAAASIALGQLGARTGLTRDDELGLLARRFDAMASGLEERERLRAVFGRYVSEEVARHSLESPDASRLGGEAREVTVLFVDLRRFSRIAEELAPEVVVAILEEYVEAMSALVDAHGGCLIEMLGDALLVAFGAPGDLADHPAHAVRCGVAMSAKIRELGERWAAAGLLPPEAIRARIGVHTGTVVAGNTGGATRMKYAVIGDTVNLAARIEALNETLGTTMLVSGETHARLPRDLAGEPRGEHTVKGRTRAVSVFAYQS